MAKEITMPALSPSMTEGTLVKWLKKEGDMVKMGDVIAEVETDKATMDLESFDSGTILKIAVPEGTRVSVNTRIAIVGKAGEKVDESQFAAQPAAKAPTSTQTTALTPASSAPTTAPTPVATPSSNGKESRTKASPLARKVAQEKGVSLLGLTGTGPGGRIVKRDVLSAPAGGGAASIWGSAPVAKDQQITLSNMRRTIAKRLLESKTQIPHFYLSVEIDAEPLLKTRASVNAGLEAAGKKAKLSVNDFVLKACVEALRKVPAVNASFTGETIQQHGAVHMSFAVAIPDGLITPVIRDAHAKSLITMSGEAKSLGAKAKEMALKPEEFTGGTFTVSNLGMLGIDNFCAIINPPQAAILAVGNVVKKPIVNERDEIVVGQRMAMTLSCDHRVVDGAVAATFLKEVRTFLENPTLLLI